MSAMSHDHEADKTGDEGELIRSRLDELDRSLMAAMAQDARLQSGVSRNRFTSDLDFIQMTGLTRSPAMASPPSRTVPQTRTPVEDMNPAHPVIFYEAGVRDVDHAVAAGGRGNAEISSSEPPPLEPLQAETGPSVALTRTLETLRELVTELARDLGQPPRVQGDDTTYASPARHADTPSQAGPPALANAAASPSDKDAPGFERTAEVHEGMERRPEELPKHASNATQQLAEAEQLLCELENQPRDFMAENWLCLEEEESEGDGTLHDYDNEAARARRSMRYASPMRKRVFYSALALGGFVLTVTAVLVFRETLWPIMRSPEQLMIAARAAMAQSRYEQAAQDFLLLARRYPAHPLSAEAWFEAGVALKQSASMAGNAARTRREEALSVLNAFVRDHPADARRLRAECLIGILYFELGNYPKAVETLRTPAQQVEDPATALQVLRTLAAAHRVMGEYAAAESAYLQAARVARNDSADTDYIDLGDMCLERARLAENAPDRRRLLESALKYWDRALNTPGGDPVRRAQIHKRIGLARGDLDALGDGPDGPEHLTP